MKPPQQQEESESTQNQNKEGEIATIYVYNLNWRTSAATLGHVFEQVKLDLSSLHVFIRIQEVTRSDLHQSRCQLAMSRRHSGCSMELS